MTLANQIVTPFTYIGKLGASLFNISVGNLFHMQIGDNQPSGNLNFGVGLFVGVVLGSGASYYFLRAGQGSNQIQVTKGEAYIGNPKINHIHGRDGIFATGKNTTIHIGDNQQHASEGPVRPIPFLYIGILSFSLMQLLNSSSNRSEPVMSVMKNFHSSLHSFLLAINLQATLPKFDTLLQNPNLLEEAGSNWLIRSRNFPFCEEALKFGVEASRIYTNRLFESNVPLPHNLRQQFIELGSHFDIREEALAQWINFIEHERPQSDEAMKRIVLLVKNSMKGRENYQSLRP